MAEHAPGLPYSCLGGQTHHWPQSLPLLLLLSVRPQLCDTAAQSNSLPLLTSAHALTQMFFHTNFFLQPIILFNYYTFANISLFCFSILVQSRTGSLSVGRTVALLTSLPVHKFHQNIFSSQFFLNGSHPLPGPPSLSHSLSLSCSPTLNALS